MQLHTKSRYVNMDLDGPVDYSWLLMAKAPLKKSPKAARPPRPEDELTTRPNGATAKPAKPAKATRTQAERSETTTRALVEAARRLFATRGFAATSIDDILKEVGITRGALYHHFATKTELFRVVFEEQEKLLMTAVAKATARKEDPWAAFRAGCEAFLEACLDPDTQRIILIDATSVIGWDAMREIESRYALALLEGGLERAMAAGKLARRPARPLAHLLLGALSESAMAIARSADPTATMKAARLEITRLLTALAAS
jgi:AcrR family transcriptional regulator